MTKFCRATKLRDKITDVTSAEPQGMGVGKGAMSLEKKTGEGRGVEGRPIRPWACIVFLA